VSRRLGTGSGLWPAYVEQGEQKNRNGQWTLASCVEEGEQKSRNGQWTLGRLCRGG
jgi:hypothetical protein